MINVVIEVQVHVPGPAPAAGVRAAAGGDGEDAAARPPRHGHGLPGLREARARQVQRLRLRRVLARDHQHLQHPAPRRSQHSSENTIGNEDILFVKHPLSLSLSLNKSNDAANNEDMMRNCIYSSNVVIQQYIQDHFYVMNNIINDL